jgi:hypothetical protein
MVSPVHGDYRRCQAETPLSDLFKFAEPALNTPMSQQVSETRECKNCHARLEQLGKLPRMLTKPALKIFRCCECNEVRAEPY